MALEDRTTYRRRRRLKIPPVDRLHRRATRRARRRRSRASRSLDGYSQDFVDQAKCKEIALEPDRRRARTSSSRSPGSCGLGALAAAKEQGVWGIGVDNDQCVPRPAHPDERPEARRPRRLPDDPRPSRTGNVRRRRRTRSSPSRTAASGSARSAPRRRSQAIIAKLTAVSKQIIDGKIKAPKTVGKTRRNESRAGGAGRRARPPSFPGEDGSPPRRP